MLAIIFATFLACLTAWLWTQRPRATTRFVFPLPDGATLHVVDIERHPPFGSSTRRVLRYEESSGEPRWIQPGDDLQWVVFVHADARAIVLGNGRELHARDPATG